MGNNRQKFLASVFAQLESNETIYEACTNSAMTWAGPVTSTFRFVHSMPELRVSLCAAVPIELYRLSGENGADPK